MTGFEILCCIVLLICIWYYISDYSFWERHGVPGPKPVPFLGNCKDVILGRISQAEYIDKIYKEYENEPMVGLYMRDPQLLLRDPELIKDVLIRDFNNFVDRGFEVFEKTEPLSEHLGNLEGKRWKPLRQRICVLFTATKMKEMFVLIRECADQFEKYMEKLMEKGELIEVHELCAKYTTDTIVSCVFGVQANSMSDEDGQFRRKGRQLFAVNFENTLLFKMRLYVPTVYRYIGYVVSEKRHTPFFTKLVSESIKYRQENDIYRPDFINMLMELKKHPEYLPNIELTDTFVAAQAFIFFGAGFETSSSTMSNALYELARHQEIQEKLREEIRRWDAELKGNWKYDDLKKVGYLDKVIKETLRKYPPTITLFRQSSAEYTFRDTKVTIPKGTKLLIPQYSLQRDAYAYSNPDAFDPERFNEEQVAARHPMYYLPFGDGPRNCIGYRIANAQMKMGLITFFRKYKVDISEKTTPYKYDPDAVILSPIGGIHLKVTRVDN